MKHSELLVQGYHLLRMWWGIVALLPIFPLYSELGQRELTPALLDDSQGGSYLGTSYHAYTLWLPVLPAQGSPNRQGT